jgi:TrmH family RNA methyltransferase
MHYVDLPAISKMKTDKGGHVFGTFLDGENMYMKDLDNGTDSPSMIVIGNESVGISGPMSELVTDRLYIPPFPQDQPGSESLNAAVATAITVAEFRRRLYK